jgi:hemin uptake protein HemP
MVPHTAPQPSTSSARALVAGSGEMPYGKPAAAPVPSEELLQGRSAVEISHNGSVYRLQSTKLGKLILTK